MTAPSITSSDSFQIRAQRSDGRRIVVMLAVLGALLLIVITRRATGGVVMADNRVFIPSIAVILAVAMYESLMLRNAVRASRENRLLPRWRWIVNAAIEAAAPLALLTIMHFRSSRGELAALSAPLLLVLPIIILLSILRLRPRFTLWTGIIAGLAHAGLVVHTIIDVHPPHDAWPVLFTYSVLLMLSGVAASMVAREVKAYVREAADEATAAEIANQRLQVMERDLSIAREIQRGLLPTSPPDLPGFEIAGISTPADQTGGDYYDWQTLPDGRVTVVMADVTGHGIGPALVMAVCRAYARASTAVVPMLGPFLNRLNELIHADVGGSRFITFAMALINPKASTIELLSAGHGPTFFFRARQRTVERFGGDGFPLGIVPEGDYGEARTLEMTSGDILLLLTDGFFEWQRLSDNQAFGIERIEELLVKHASADATTILQAIDSAVRTFTAGAAQNDDMTAVALKKL